MKSMSLGTEKSAYTCETGAGTGVGKLGEEKLANGAKYRNLKSLHFNPNHFFLYIGLYANRVDHLFRDLFTRNSQIHVVRLTIVITEDRLL